MCIRQYHNSPGSHINSTRLNKLNHPSRDNSSNRSIQDSFIFSCLNFLDYSLGDADDVLIEELQKNGFFFYSIVVALVCFGVFIIIYFLLRINQFILSKNSKREREGSVDKSNDISKKLCNCKLWQWIKIFELVEKGKGKFLDNGQFSGVSKVSWLVSGRNVPAESEVAPSVHESVEQTYHRVEELTCERVIKMSCCV